MSAGVLGFVRNFRAPVLWPLAFFFLPVAVNSENPVLEQMQLETHIKDSVASIVDRFLPREDYALHVYVRQKKIKHRNILSGATQVVQLQQQSGVAPPELPGFVLEKPINNSPSQSNSQQFFEVIEKVKIKSVDVNFLYDKDIDTSKITPVKNLIVKHLAGYFGAKASLTVTPAEFFHASAQSSFLSFIKRNWILLILGILLAAAGIVAAGRWLRAGRVALEQDRLRMTGEHARAVEDPPIYDPKKKQVNQDITDLRQFEVERDKHLESIIFEVVDSPILSRYFFMNADNQSFAILQAVLFTHSLRVMLGRVLHIDLVAEASDSVLQALGNELQQAKLIAGLRKICNELRHFKQLNASMIHHPERMLCFLTNVELKDVFLKHRVEVLVFSIRLLQKEQVNYLLQQMPVENRERFFSIVSERTQLAPSGHDKINAYLKQYVLNLQDNLVSEIMSQDELVDMTIINNYLSGGNIYKFFDQRNDLRDKYAYLFLSDRELKEVDGTHLGKVLNRYSNEQLAAILNDSSLRPAEEKILSSLAEARRPIVQALSKSSRYEPRQILSIRQDLHSRLELSQN